MAQIRLPDLTPMQRKILSERARFNTCAAGRRAGKTVLGIYILLTWALKGYPCGWFAPYFKHMLAVWRELVTITGDIGESNKNEKIIELPTGGSIEFFTLDAAAPARSRKFKAVVVDEAAWANDLQDQWNGAIRPTLADMQGEAWFLSSPKGLNFFYTLHQRGLDPEREDWRSWTFPTSANPYIQPEEIEAARESTPELLFQQEYEARFVDVSGAVFRNVLRAVWEPREELKRAQRVEPWMTWAPTFAIGIDFARTHDFTVLTAVCDDPFQPIGGAEDTGRDPAVSQADRWNSCSVVEIDRFRGVEYAQQMGRIKAMYERFGRPIILAESNAMGQPIIEQLARDGMRVRPFHTSNSSKATLIDALALAFERGRVRIPNDPTLIGELLSFQATLLPASGLMRFAAPSGGTDDMVMSLALAVEALRKHSMSRSNNPYYQERMKNIGIMLGATGAPI